MVAQNNKNTPHNRRALLHLVAHGVLTIPELADALGVNRATAWRYAKADNITPASMTAARASFVSFAIWRATNGKTREQRATIASLLSQWGRQHGHMDR